MTGSTHSTGAFAKLLFEPGASPHTFDASSELYEFLAENLGKEGRIVGGNEVSGSRSHRSERTRKAASYFRGSIVKNISPAELVTLLPKMLGAAASGTTFALDEDVPYFGVMIDRDYGVFKYTDCKIDRWILKGRAPELGEDGEPDLLTLQLDIIASDEDPAASWPGSPPSLGTSAAYAPYVFQDSCSGITLNGSTRDAMEFVIVGDNKIKALYTNCLTPHSLVPRDRIIMARFRVPWNSTNADLYEQSAAGAAASVVLTNSTVSTTFTFGRLQVPPKSPFVRGKDTVDLVLEGQATMVSTTRELVVTNDSTP